MTGLDLETDARYDIPVLSILLNNFEMAGYETPFGGDFGTVAEGLGAYSERIETPPKSPPPSSVASRRPGRGRPSCWSSSPPRRRNAPGPTSAELRDRSSRSPLTTAGRLASGTTKWEVTIMANGTMDHVREDDRIVVRLDPGEEVLDSLETLRDEYDIENGFLTGIGAVDRVTLGHYDVDAQEYSEEEFTGQFEVTSFLGNIGPDKIHTHIQVANDAFESLGGHCSGARVSGTFEVLVTLGETSLTHRLDERTGLDVFDI